MNWADRLPVARNRLARSPQHPDRLSLRCKFEVVTDRRWLNVCTAEDLGLRHQEVPGLAPVEEDLNLAPKVASPIARYRWRPTLWSGSHRRSDDLAAGGLSL